jgi:hypothetical protein
MADPSVRLRLRRIKLDRARVMASNSPVYRMHERAGKALVGFAEDELAASNAIRSGFLYNSLDYRIVDVGWRMITDVGSLKYDVPYAPFVHDGTPKGSPGTGRIYPKRAKNLRFTSNGAVYVRPSVRGQKANPYLRRAIAQLRNSDLAGR